MFPAKLASNTPYGEWIATELPQAIFLNSVQITPCGQNNERGPKDFKIYGSNDGINWDELLDVTGSTAVEETIYGGITSNTMYSHFAIVITRTNGGKAVGFAEVRYIGNTGNQGGAIIIYKRKN